MSPLMEMSNRTNAQNANNRLQEQLKATKRYTSHACVNAGKPEMEQA